ncbi:MAG: hybrid sensor histidine kinase/response regulator [Deltaproteobacteria bacterium]|nr:hybrid sensor histidine kinase/response regulator [Deltaproteobacteria bacterium]
MASILYVDDDTLNLTVFEAACAGDFSILTATNADVALGMMRRHEVGVLLTDQRMPGMSGIELAELVKNEFPDTIRMLVTAYSDLNATVDAINRGQVLRYLRKPWDPRELKNSLHEALGVYEMNRRIRELERRLVETERVYALGIVAAGIAHEIRNPMNWIVNNLAMAQDNLREIGELIPAEDPRGQAVYARLRDLEEEVSDALQGAARITDIAKGIELSTRTRQEDDAVDLAEVLSLTLKSVLGELRQRSQLRLDTRPVPKIRGSRTKLGQVILNLVVNAIQALPRRPQAENLIGIKLAPEGSRVRLEVEDNGTGISVEHLDRIFDPFFTTKADSGTGLGLAISKKIVEEMGGEIQVQSEPGRGTRFQITWPALASS